MGEAMTKNDLASFEKSVRRYEQERGNKLDEEMLLGIVAGPHHSELEPTENVFGCEGPTS